MDLTNYHQFVVRLRLNAKVVILSFLFQFDISSITFWNVTIQFSQKSLSSRKKQPLTLSRQVLVQQAPIISCCYYTKRGTAAKRWYRKKKLKIWRRGRAGTGARLIKLKAQYHTSQTRCSSFLWYM